MVVFTEEAAKRAALNAASRGQMVECLLAGPQEDSEPTGLKGGCACMHAYAGEHISFKWAARAGGLMVPRQHGGGVLWTHTCACACGHTHCLGGQTQHRLRCRCCLAQCLESMLVAVPWLGGVSAVRLQWHQARLSYSSRIQPICSDDPAAASCCTSHEC